MESKPLPKNRGLTHRLQYHTYIRRDYSDYPDSSRLSRQLVLITTYAFSIIGVMTFKIGANEEVSCARRLLCPWKPSPLLRGRAD
eukprot:SAG25_NODE_1648_length_2617_cov_2.503574_2_plen_85_part_00